MTNKVGVPSYTPCRSVKEGFLHKGPTVKGILGLSSRSVSFSVRWCDHLNCLPSLLEKETINVSIKLSSHDSSLNKKGEGREGRGSEKKDKRGRRFIHSVCQ